MPFCPNCGAATGPGQNYCAACGALLKTSDIPPPPPPPLRTVPRPVLFEELEESKEQAAPPPAPAGIPPGTPPGPPPGTPPGPPPGTPPGAPLPAAGAGIPPIPRPVLAGIAAAVIVIAAALFFGLPMLTGSSLSLSSLPATTAPTPPETTATAETPVPAPTATTPPPAPEITVEARYETAYERIYSSNRTYLFGEKVTIPHTLVHPPLYIKFNVTPAMVNDTKVINIGTPGEYEVFAIYPDPAAWFEVKVLTAAGGDVVDSRGYGVAKGYSGVNQQEFLIRSSGDYVVELSGNRVMAVVDIRIGTS